MTRPIDGLHRAAHRLGDTVRQMTELSLSMNREIRAMPTDPNLTTAASAAIALIIGIEGPPSNDPDDPGGQTDFGCDQASWPDLLKRVPASIAAQLPLSVKALTYATATLAYLYGHWLVQKCDQLPKPLALVTFDASVNQGQGWAPRGLQEALGVGVDGDIGTQTLAAAASCDVQTAVCELARLRDYRYHADSQFGEYGKGWLLRLFHIVYVSDIYDVVQASVPAHIGTSYKGPNQ